MATPGKRLDDGLRRWILRIAATMSIRAVAREAGVSRNTVRKILRNSLAK